MLVLLTNAAVGSVLTLHPWKEGRVHRRPSASQAGLMLVLGIGVRAWRRTVPTPASLMMVRRNLTSSSGVTVTFGGMLVTWCGVGGIMVDVKT